jgi:hypothetical protein
MESNEPLVSPARFRLGMKGLYAIISLVLGVSLICAPGWYQICGFPLGIAGLVLGYLGMKVAATEEPGHSRIGPFGFWTLTGMCKCDCWGGVCPGNREDARRADEGLLDR